MESLGLSRWLVEVCGSMKMEVPFEIQQECIPSIMSGDNVLGCAPTGQGKTAAYVLPMLEKFSQDPSAWFGMVLAPTRELAQQICERVITFGERCGVGAVLIVGGEDLMKQKSVLFDGVCHIVVGTPGRIAQISEDPGIRRKMKRLRIFCLDECDQLMSPGLCEDVLKIREVLRSSVQILCFSATIKNHSEEIQTLLTNGGDCSYKKVDLTASLASLRHRKITCDDVAVYHFLHYLLTDASNGVFASERGIIFAPTVEECEVLHRTLSILEVSCTLLHSRLSSRERNRNYDLFKGEQRRVLVSTDLCSRGLDLPYVDWVVNTTVPMKFEAYVHRAGRCARAGRPGICLTFVRQVLFKQKEHDINLNRINDIAQQLADQSADGQAGRADEQVGTVLEYDFDHSKGMMYPAKINKAIAKAKLGLEEDPIIDKIRKRSAGRPY